MSVELELRALQLQVITLESQVAAHEADGKNQWSAIVSAMLIAVGAFGAAVAVLARG